LRMLTRLPTFAPSSMGFFYSAELARKVRALMRDNRFDLIFVHCSSVAQYVAEAAGIPKILDFGDMDSQKWLDYARFKPFPLSLGYRLEGVKLMREEKSLARRFDMCTATTRAEWETLNSYQCQVETDWFPNGVDTEYFSPSGEPYDANTISFVGRMDYYPNQECMFDFCARSLPLLQQRRSQIQLKIVGADPSPAVRRLANLPGVTVTGSVADVRPYVRQSGLMVAPLNIARGTQNKILEAMAMGVPVVTSPLGAAGVDAVEGDHLLVARNPAEYAEAILRILDQSDERDRLARAGRQRMLTHHSWETSMRRLDTIVDRCLANGARTRQLSSLSERSA
jgi:sugar transferase (PEP-CTERM/EpsH1 system associated)